MALPIYRALASAVVLVKKISDSPIFSFQPFVTVDKFSMVNNANGRYYPKDDSTKIITL